MRRDTVPLPVGVVNTAESTPVSTSWSAECVSGVSSMASPSWECMWYDAPPAPPGDSCLAAGVPFHTAATSPRRQAKSKKGMIVQGTRYSKACTATTNAHSRGGENPSTIHAVTHTSSRRYFSASTAEKEGGRSRSAERRRRVGLAWMFAQQVTHGLAHLHEHDGDVCCSQPDAVSHEGHDKVPGVEGKVNAT